MNTNDAISNFIEIILYKCPKLNRRVWRTMRIQHVQWKRDRLTDSFDAIKKNEKYKKHTL